MSRHGLDREIIDEMFDDTESQKVCAIMIFTAAEALAEIRKAPISTILRAMADLVYEGWRPEGCDGEHPWSC